MKLNIIMTVKLLVPQIDICVVIFWWCEEFVVKNKRLQKIIFLKTVKLVHWNYKKKSHVDFVWEASWTSFILLEVSKHHWTEINFFFQSTWSCVGLKTTTSFLPWKTTKNNQWKLGTSSQINHLPNMTQ